MHDSKYQCHIPPTNLLLLAAKQEPYKKAYFVTKTFEELSAKCSEEWTSRQKKKDKTERVTGLGRRTREEIVKLNQMTTLRFQTGGETSDIPGLPSGILTVEKKQLKEKMATKVK